jgi:hypothetical protein
VQWALATRYIRDVATKIDVVPRLLRDIRDEIRGVRGEVSALRGEMREEFRAVRGELRDGFRSVESKLTSAATADSHIRKRIVSLESWAEKQGYHRPALGRRPAVSARRRSRR